MVHPHLVNQEVSSEPLTKRERDVLRMLAQNMSDREIAEKLVLSINSVKWFARRIYEKLGVENRQQAVRKAQQDGLLEAERKQRTVTHNLPRQLTGLVGRKVEILAVVELVWKHSLVTLTGSGGVGKTRLALAAAQELLDDFQDGVFYVDLVPLNDPTLVVSQTLAAVGLREEPGRNPIDSLCFYFSERQALLIFDNCEHLAGACATLVHELLSRLSELKVLATSREPLGVGGEVLYGVAGLGCPETGCEPVLEDLREYESIELFVERAQAVMPRFGLDGTNCQAVLRICQRLDGIPLAIELAAARSASLGVAQVAERLERSFNLLTGGGRTTMERHRTLRSAIEWSYQLISEPERILLRRLGVFVGGWTLAAAESVCAGNGIRNEDVLELLSLLVTKSLVLVDHLEAQEPRYRMLVTIQQFALEELLRSGESEILRKRHFEWAQCLCDEAGKYLESVKRLEWVKKLRKERHNLRAAIEWSIEEEHDMLGGMRMFENNYANWFGTGLHESAALLVKACEVVHADPNIPLIMRAKALWLEARYLEAACVSVYKSKYDQALALCEGLGKEGDVLRTLITLLIITHKYNVEGDLQNAYQLVTETEEKVRSMIPGEKYLLARVLEIKTWILRFLGEKEKAEICCDEYAAIQQELGITWGYTYWMMAESAYRRGDFELAKIYCAKYREQAIEFDNPGGVALIDRILAKWMREKKMEQAALPLYKNALRYYINNADSTMTCVTLGGIALTWIGLAESLKELDKQKIIKSAARILSGTAKAQKEYKSDVYFEDGIIFQTAVEQAKELLGQEEYDRAWAEGARLTLKEVVELALTQTES